MYMCNLVENVVLTTVEEHLFRVFVNRALRRVIVQRWRRGCRRLHNEKLLHNLYSVTTFVISDNTTKDETENGTCSEIRNWQ
jgi:hypothetical protein